MALIYKLTRHRGEPSLTQYDTAVDGYPAPSAMGVTVFLDLPDAKQAALAIMDQKIAISENILKKYKEKRKRMKAIKLADFNPEHPTVPEIEPVELNPDHIEVDVTVHNGEADINANDVP
jgi:hypothetical protein